MTYLERCQIALQQISARAGFEVRIASDRLLVDGRSLPIPRDKAGWEPLDLRSAFPSRAHGDQREKLLFMVGQDAGDADASELALDHGFRLTLEHHLAVQDDLARETLADAMRDEYWVEPRNLPFLLPYHSALPLSFQHSLSESRPSRYRMFRGVILPFLCWTGTEVDEGLVADVLDFLNQTDGFTLIDRLLLEAVQSYTGHRSPEASARALIDRFEKSDRGDVAEALRNGAFCQPSLDRFQADLRTVLEMRARLPRRDYLDTLTFLISMHVGLLYYRVALVLGQQIERLIAACGQLQHPDVPADCPCDALAACPLAGRIRFRMGTRGYRPASLRDACVESYAELTNRRLLALPASIITANLVEQLSIGLGGPAETSTKLRKIIEVAGEDRQFADRLDSGAAAYAALNHAFSKRAATAADIAAVALRPPGIYALLESVLLARRTRLRHLSRDVVNQLVKRERGSLVRSNGTRVTFFELDEDFLFMLVKLICREAEVPFDGFLEGLRLYGLAPQDQAEADGLADTLERLGMLKRYSDAPESAYVQHILD